MAGDLVPQQVLLPQDVWDATPQPARELVVSLIGQVQTLTAQVRTLEQRLAALEEQMGANSTNSSKPPSGDPPGTLPRRREKSGKRKGGQPCHKGRHRELVPPDKVDRVLQHFPSRCSKCNRELTAAHAVTGSPPARHQTWEIPPVRAEVTEHQIYKCCCPDCGEICVAELPTGVPSGAFGPNLTALAGLLVGHCRLSLRLCEFLLRDGFGVAVSLGALKGLENQISESLAGPVAEAHAAAQQAPVLNVDDTGWKEANEKAVLWTGNTPDLAIFQITKKKDHETAKAFVGEDFEGILGADRATTYSFHEVKRRQSCWAHLDRHFQRMEDRGGESKAIGTWGKAEVDRFFHEWHEFKDGKISRQQLQANIVPIRARMGRLLDQGCQCGQSDKDKSGAKSPHAKTASTCANIRAILPAYFTCCYHECVEPTNNISERALRHPVQWRKTSFGTQSEAGSRFVERILTTVETCRRQGRNVLEFLTRAIRALHHGSSPPSLLPVPSG